MNDTPSSDSENDEEYVPGKENEDASEDSDCLSDELDNETGDNNVSKRNRKKSSNCRKNKRLKIDIEEEKSTQQVDVDAIWADFKRDCSRLTDSRVSIMGYVEGHPIEECKNTSKINDLKDDESLVNAIEQKTESVVPNSEKIDSKVKVKDVTRQKPKVLGLEAVVRQIEKKGKINVLDRSKRDWDTFKSKEGITENLGAYNKGKKGYLERRDFLSRTDLRQFEKEKEVRTTQRKHI